MKKIIFVIISLTMSFYFSCRTTEDPKIKSIVPVLFEVSTEHRNYFFDLPKESFTSEEMKQIFLNRKEISNEVCEMVYGKKNFNKKRIYEFIKEENFQKDPFKNWGHPLPKLIAGCWNFFRLNDVKPNQDFALIKKLYPTEKKDCYSVGFLQAYLMHSLVTCNSLTMIDIDWRILEGHSQLIDLFQNKELDTEVKLLEGLKKITVAWIARFDNKPLDKETKADLNTFCYYLHHEMCKEHLLKFQKDFLLLENVFFRLSSLHDYNYKNKNNYTKIIYLSNAIDDLYTSKDQFKKLISSVYENLAQGQKAVFVHHSAGWQFFGIYELTKQDSSPQIKTICKDVYKTTPVAGIDSAVPYITHFERWENSIKTNETCSSKL